MIKTTFDIDAIAEAVGFWIPGFRQDLTLADGDTADYRLRCTRNELIDDFEVHVAVSGDEARVTVTGLDGRSAERTMPASDVLTPLPAVMVPMAIEGLPVDGGLREYTVCMFSGKRSGMAWMHDGIAYRTIHDTNSYRMCFDLVGSSAL